jgi:hypothetical protein
MHRRSSRRAAAWAAAFLALIPFPLAPQPASAQSAGIVRGAVVDSSGAAVAGAVVSLDGSDSRYSQSVQSDSQGAYRFYNVPFGDYRLSAKAAGFADAVTEVPVHTGQPIEMPIALSPVGANEVVTVTDSLGGDHVGSEFSVANASLQRLPVLAPTKQLESVLLQMPGIVADENGRFHPRGAHNQASFVVDGVQISDQMSTVFSNNIDSQNVEGMNLISGFVPAEYGNKVAAVINVASKSGLGSDRDVFGSVSFGLASFSAWDASLQAGGKAGEHFGYFASASHTQSRRYLDTPFQNETAFGLVAGDEGFHNSGGAQRYFARLDWTPNDANIFKITMSGGRSLFDVPNLPSQQLAGQDQRQFIRDLAIYPSWLHVIKPSWSLNAAPYFRTASANLVSSPFDTPLRASQERHLTAAGLNLSLSYSGHGHTAKIGTDSFLFPVSENFAFAITDPAFNEPGSEEFNSNLLAYDLTRGGDFFRFSDAATGHEYSFYAQDSYTYRGLTVSGGVRYDDFRVLHTEHQLSPRFGAAYQFPARLGRTAVRFSYNRVFQTPSSENLLLASSASSAALIPPDRLEALGGVGVRLIPSERGDWFEVGVSQPVRDWFRVDASYYAKHIDFIADTNQFLNTGVIFPVALTSGTVRGFEVHVDVPTHRGFSGNFSFSRSKAEGVPPFAGGLFLSGEAVEVLESAGEPFRLDHDQPVAASFLLAWDSDEKLGLFATLEGRYDSGLPTEIEDVEAIRANPDLAPGLALVDFSGDPTRVESRFLLNLSAGKRLFKRENYSANVQVSLLNLTNETKLYNFLSVFSGTHYIPPRSMSVRLGFSF